MIILIRLGWKVEALTVALASAPHSFKFSHSFIWLRFHSVSLAGVFGGRVMS
jgi:hypothetical protein